MNSMDEEDDPELPDPSDMDQDDYTVMSRCPHCKKMIDAESEMCPRCGSFISIEQAPGKYPVWILVGMGLAIAGIIYDWILHL